MILLKKEREIFARYLEALGSLPGVVFMPEPDYGRTTRWLSCLTIDSEIAGVDRDFVMGELEKHNIEM